METKFEDKMNVSFTLIRSDQWLPGPDQAKGFSGQKTESLNQSG